MPTLPPPSQGGGDYTPPPAGTFPAICFRVVDLGRQKTTFSGETKIQHKVMISWEIADAEERMTDGRPFTVHKQYTYSTHEKSNFRKDLEAWRGVPFKESDFGPGGFDIKNLLGKECMLSIVHDEREGSVYANVKSIAKMPKNMIASPLVNPKCFVWLEESDFDREAFDTLSDRIKAKIMLSPEWAVLNGTHPIQVARPMGNNSVTSGPDQLRAAVRQSQKVWEEDPLEGLEVRG